MVSGHEVLDEGEVPPDQAGGHPSHCGDGLRRMLTSQEADPLQADNVTGKILQGMPGGTSDLEGSFPSRLSRTMMGLWVSPRPISQRVRRVGMIL